MPPAPPRLSSGSSSTSWSRRIVDSTFLTPSGSSLTPNFTQLASRNSRRNRSARHVYPGYHTSRPPTVPNRPQINHEAPSKNKPFLSPMASRELSSGQMLIYLRDSALTDRTVAEFRDMLSGPLGFDIEYRPNYIKGRPLNRTALVQLTSESITLLIQVSAMSVFPDTVKNILEDPTIIKAGVGIQADADKLWKDFRVNSASCLELGYLARAVDQQWSNSKGLISLARLVKAYEGRVMTKPKHVQMSNWELPLTKEQQDYAVGDADAAFFVLQKLYAILPSVQPPPAKTLYLF